MRKVVHKLHYVTAAAYEYNANVCTRNTDLLQCSRRGLRIPYITQLRQITSNKTELEKPPWRVLFFGTDDFSLPSLKMLFREL